MQNSYFPQSSCRESDKEDRPPYSVLFLEITASCFLYYCRKMQKPAEDLEYLLLGYTLVAPISSASRVAEVQPIHHVAALQLHTHTRQWQFK